MKYIKLYEGFWSDRKNRRKNDINISKIESEINNHLSKFIGKKYDFQYSTYIWKSKSSNYKEIDHDKLTFKGVELELIYNYDDDSNSNIVDGVFFYLIFNDKNNDDILIYFKSNSITENEIDLEYSKPWEEIEKSLSGNITNNEEDLDKINYDDPSRYPKRDNAIMYVPSGYNTVELLKELKILLRSINDQIKNNNTI